MLSLALGMAVLGGLLAFGDVARVLAAAARLRGPVLVACGACLVGHAVVRGAAWCFLLRRLEVRTPLRAQVLAFGVGEVAKDLPAGAFLPNYVLRESRGAGMGESGAALGLGTVAWARWVAVFVAVATAVLVTAASRWLSAEWLCRIAPERLARSEWAAKTLKGVDELRRGLARLMRADVVAVVLGAAAAGELLAAGALFALVRGIVEADEAHAGFGAVLAAHGASVAVALGLPLPVDFGALEVSGVAALMAVGLPRHTAVAAMVLNRAVSIVVALVMGGTLAVTLRHELSRVWGSAGGNEQGEEDERLNENEEGEQEGRRAA